MAIREQIKKALTDSLMETFSCVFSIVPRVSEVEPYVPLKGGGKKVFASIGLAGSMDGAMVIILPEEGACSAVSKMLGCELNEVTQDVLDGAGELVNMLAGGLKTGLSGTKHTFESSVPTVVHMEKFLEVARVVGTERICMRVDCDDMGFDIFVSFIAEGKYRSGEALKKSAAREAEKKEDASAMLESFIKEE